MDIKYIVLGVNIIILGVLISIYGYLIYSTQLLGVGASIILVGGVLAVLGYTYVEPTASLLIDYFKEVSRFASLILEDLRLSNTLPSMLVRDGKLYMVFTTLSFSDIGDFSPGLNVVGGEPLYVIPLNNPLLESVGLESVYEVESRLRDRLVGEYGICSGVSLSRDGDRLELRLSNLDSRLVDIGYSPLNPIDLMVSATLSGIVGRSLVFERRVLEGGVYRAFFRVV